MPSRRDFLSATVGALGGGALTGGSVLALTDTDTDSSTKSSNQTPTTTTPTPGSTTVHTSTSDPTTTHTPATTTTSTPTATTTTSTTESDCHSEKFDCQTLADAKDLGLQIRESVVYIDVDLPGTKGSHGTGWFIDDQGTILTNDHVINGNEELTVYTLDGTEYTPTVKGRSKDENPDAALLEIDADSTPLEFGSEDTLDTDEPLLEVGHPAVSGAWIISLGRYEGINEYRTSPDDLTSSMPTSSGSSGSPLLTLDGKVVGLTYGGMPTDRTAYGEAPEPMDDDVHTYLELNQVAVHEPSSQVQDQLDEWG